MSYADRYTEIEEIDAAPSGRLFQAEHGVLRRSVLIRVISEAYAASHGDAIREAIRTCAGLAHPAILAPTDADLGADEIYFVTERPGAGTLAQHLESGNVAGEKAVRWSADILSALITAHAGGLVHGALSPWVVHLRHDGGAAVGDFGIPGVRYADESREVTIDARLAPYLPASAFRPGAAADAAGDYASAATIIVRLLSGVLPAAGLAFELGAPRAPATLERCLRLMLRGDATDADATSARDALSRWAVGEHEQAAPASSAGFSRTRNVTAVDHSAGDTDDDDDSAPADVEVAGAAVAEAAPEQALADDATDDAAEGDWTLAGADEVEDDAWAARGESDDAFEPESDVADASESDDERDAEAAFEAFADSGGELDAAFDDVGAGAGDVAAVDVHGLDDTAGHPRVTGIEADADDIEIVVEDPSPSTSGLGGRTMAMDGTDLLGRVAAETQANPTVGESDADDISQRVKDKLDKYAHLFDDAN